MLIADVADLCLAFANTRMWRGRAAPIERLATLGDLLGWAAGSGAGEDLVARIARQAEVKPALADALLAEAIALREAIYRMFAALAEGDAPPAQDFLALNRALADAPARSELAWHGDRYGWQIGDPAATVPTLLAPVLWSAGDLLVGGQRERVRRCANQACLWLFLDQSKAGTRRWCDMASCGNRAKARRHYQRTKSVPG